jgi:hypothetical protein
LAPLLWPAHSLFAIKNFLLKKISRAYKKSGSDPTTSEFTTTL